MKGIFSSEIVDNAKHKMILGGGDFSRFNINPVLLFSHNDTAVPVGIIKNLRVENKQLVGEILWDDNDPEALKVKSKYDTGFMRGFSIRAIVKKFHSEIIDSIKVDVIDEWELVEISCVSIPMNREALVVEKSATSQDAQGVETESPEVIIATFFSDYKKTNSIPMKDIFAKLGIVAADLQNEGEVLKKIGDLQTKATKTNEDLTKSLADNQTLTKKLEDLEAESTTKKINDLVDGAVLTKKITAGEAESFKDLAKTNFDTVKKMLDAKQGVVSATEQIVASGNNAGDAAVLKCFNENKEKGYMWFMKEKEKELAILKKSYPAQFEELRATL